MHIILLFNNWNNNIFYLIIKYNILLIYNQLYKIVGSSTIPTLNHIGFNFLAVIL